MLKKFEGERTGPPLPLRDDNGDQVSSIRSGRLEPLPLPSPAAWTAAGLVVLDEVQAGHQSRVFRTTRGHEQLVAKLTDARMANPAHRSRVELLAELAEGNKLVVGPVSLGGDLVQRIGGWLIVCYPHIDGTMPDIENPQHVEAMGSALAGLHDFFAGWPDTARPPVSGLQEADSTAFGPRQLIHGDFSDANLLVVDGEIKILDFDECGYGSIEFELGNTLYMVMFDATIAGDPSRYRRFRTRLTQAYRAVSPADPCENVIDDAIQVRISTLRHWLDDPASAPIGIRTADDEWHEKLRWFLEQAASGWWADTR